VRSQLTAFLFCQKLFRHKNLIDFYEKSFTVLFINSNKKNGDKKWEGNSWKQMESVSIFENLIIKEFASLLPACKLGFFYVHS
jgi:hypothetical protein